MRDVRIAVIADVHANIYALSAFLEFIDKLGDISCIWNIGDFLQIGPHPREVAEVLLSDARFVNVLGNNEQALIQRDPTSFPANEIAHQDWTREQIGDDMLTKLKDIQSVKTEHIGGKTFILIHVPEEAKQYSNIDSVVCGHTHRQLHSIEEGIEYVNPGSLGASFENGRADFAIIESVNNEVSISLCNLAYDGSSIKADYLSRNVPDAQYLMNLFNIDLS